MDITIDNIVALYKRKNYILTDFNIGGIRFNDNEDLFTDIRFLLYKSNGEYILKQWNQTTKPGKSALLKPVNALGCAILKEGQYINCWAVGLHFGHNALMQIGKLNILRDNKKNGTFETEGLLEVDGSQGNGIDLHGVWASNIPNWDGEYPNVGNWSEGCQVMARPHENEDFITLCKASGLKYFTYTLFNITDVQALQS